MSCCLYLSAESGSFRVNLPLCFGSLYWKESLEKELMAVLCCRKVPVYFNDKTYFMCEGH